MLFATHTHTHTHKQNANNQDFDVQLRTPLTRETRWSLALAIQHRI